MYVTHIKTYSLLGTKGEEISKAISVYDLFSEVHVTQKIVDHHMFTQRDCLRVGFKNTIYLGRDINVCRSLIQ